MYRCNMPLTDEQRRTAEQHIEVVTRFMRSKRLDEDYWDVVIFGYLNAVRDYCERRETRENHDFNAIAWVGMKSALRTERMKSGYRFTILSLDAPVDGYEDLTLLGCGFASYEEDFTAPDVEAILSLLETDEQEIVRYLYSGYSHEEIAKLLGRTINYPDNCLKVIRAKLARYRPKAFVSA